MPIQTTCPKCRASYTLADRQLGKTVRCKQCEEVFEVQDRAEHARPKPVPATEGNIAAGRSSLTRREPLASEADDDRPLKLKDDRPERQADDNESDRRSRRKKRSLWESEEGPDGGRKKNRGGFRILPPDDYGPRGIWIIGAAAVGFTLFFLSLATWIFTIPLLIAGLVYGVLGLIRFCRCLSQDGFPVILFLLFKPIGIVLALRDPERSGKHFLFYVLWIGCMVLAGAFVDFPSKSKNAGSSPISRNERPAADAPMPPDEERPAGPIDEAEVKGTLMGTWHVRVGPTYEADWTFNADGTLDSTHGHIRRGKWTIEAEKGRIFISWSERFWETLTLPLDPKKTFGRTWNGPHWRVEAVKTK